MSVARSMVTIEYHRGHPDGPMLAHRVLINGEDTGKFLIDGATVIEIGYPIKFTLQQVPASIEFVEVEPVGDGTMRRVEAVA
jgi:hypothetical protein